MNELWQVLEHPALRAALQMAGLIFARLTPIIVLTPIFGGETMPRRLRIGLTVVLSAALLPAFLPAFQVPVQGLTYLILVAKEAVIGLTLAFFVMMVFQAIGAVGALVDLARGATLANVLDPLTQNQESILAVFFTQLAVVLFLSIGGLQLLMRSLAEGFVVLRPQDLVPARLVGPDATETPIGLVADLFLIALRLGAPAVVVLLLLDFALGIINRISSKIQVFFLGMTAKGTVGLLILLLAFGYTIDLIVGQYAGVLHAIREWTSMAGK